MQKSCLHFGSAPQDFFLFRESCNLKFACVMQVEFSSRSTFLETRLGLHGDFLFQSMQEVKDVSAVV
jgi:hypothetical protein